MNPVLPPPLPLAQQRRSPRDDVSPRTFPRYVRQCASAPTWRGPFYLMHSHWQQDLMAVMEQLRLCVRTNVPLSTGFDAIAIDNLSLYREWSPQRATRTFTFLGFLLFIASACLSSMALFFSELLPTALLLGQVGVLVGWCYFAVFRRYQKPMAVFLSLKRHLDAGNGLSEAMARMPRFFPRNLVCLVEAGEQTGKLPEILDQFSLETIQAIGTQQDFDRIIRYLTANFLVISAIIAVTVVHTMTVFDEVASELYVAPATLVPGVFLPIPTLNTLMSVGSYIEGHAYVALLIPLLVVLGAWQWWRRHRRNWSSRGVAAPLLAIPGLRGMIVAENLGGAARLLHRLLQAGVPLPQALAMVVRSDLHPWYQHWFARIHDKISGGSTLGEACRTGANRKLVPGSFQAILSLGEDQSNLLDALEWVGTQYQERFERRSRFLLGCVLPCGIFMLGYMVLTLEAAVFHALVEVADTLIE